MSKEVFLTACAVAAIIPAAAAALVDWRTHRVPDVLIALTLFPSLAAIALADEHMLRLVGVAVGVGLMASPVLLVHVVAPTAMGFGDVKLAAALGAGLGVLAPQLAVPALAAGAGLTLLVACCRRRVAVPFAPGLVVAVTAAYALGSFEGWKVAA